MILEYDISVSLCILVCMLVQLWIKREIRERKYNLISQDFQFLYNLVSSSLLI